MSEMVFCRGIIREVKKLPNETLEDLCERLCEEEDISLYFDEEKRLVRYSNYKEALLNDLYDEYFIVGDKLFKTIEYERIEEDDFGVIKLENGDYLFSGGFYNGGTCLSECIDEKLSELLKEK